MYKQSLYLTRQKVPLHTDFCSCFWWGFLMEKKTSESTKFSISQRETHWGIKNLLSFCQIWFSSRSCCLVTSLLVSRIRRWCGVTRETRRILNVTRMVIPLSFLSVPQYWIKKVGGSMQHVAIVADVALKIAQYDWALFLCNLFLAMISSGNYKQSE